jgi:outer membrane receptor protein involved in Fe transport
MSFISIGPGTQVFFLRGVSDGSNPNYSNTSATGFFLDDSSLSWYGVQPDLHLYDIQRIEVLNGPQGTTFGAGSMAGAVRYITNKPDVNSFSAGLDFDGGKIQDGGQNWTYEGFVNFALIEGTLGVRLSAFSTSHGGFIDNLLTTRHWVNGTVSDNALWAGNNYNHSHQEGGRIALKYVLNDRWSAWLSYDYQRQTAFGAWDQNLTEYPPRTNSRFGPEYLAYQAKIGQLHIDGDVGIGDLVFASTYWSLPTRRWDEYSEYMQNVNGGRQQGFTCLTDPYWTPQVNPGAPAAFSGCNVPLQYYEYHTNPERWSDELRLSSKPARGPLLGEDPRQEFRQHLLHARTAHRWRCVPLLQRLLLRGARDHFAATGGVVWLYRALRLSAEDGVCEHQLRHHQQAERRGRGGALQVGFQV